MHFVFNISDKMPRFDVLTKRSLLEYIVVHNEQAWAHQWNKIQKKKDMNQNPDTQLTDKKNGDNAFTFRLYCCSNSYHALVNSSLSHK